MIPEEAFTELRAVYERLAVALEPFRRHCASRGICCRFSTSGHMLYVTGLEAADMVGISSLAVSSAARQAAAIAQALA